MLSSLSQARNVSSCEKQRPEASYAPRVVDQAPPSYGTGHWHEGMHAGHVDTVGGMAIVTVRVARGDEICHGISGDTCRELVPSLACSRISLGHKV